MTGLSLRKLLSEFPDVEVQKVEYLANLRQSRKAGVRLIPALVYEDKKLDGVFLTTRRMRQFLESI